MSVAPGQENCVECNDISGLEGVNSVPIPKVEDPTDKSTFVPPISRRYPMVVIEYCDRVREWPRLHIWYH